jgi:hypothetical protein
MGQRPQISAVCCGVEVPSVTREVCLDSVQEGGWTYGIYHDHGSRSALRGE